MFYEKHKTLFSRGESFLVHMSGNYLKDQLVKNAIICVENGSIVTQISNTCNEPFLGAYGASQHLAPIWLQGK